MIKKTILIFVLLLTFCTATATAGQPFGLKMGMSVEELNKMGAKLSEMKHGTYKIENVPMPHPNFETYYGDIVTKNGLYWIRAVGKKEETNRHGTSLRVRFLDLRERLEKVYGKCSTTDQLFYGSIWNEPEDYMMALLKKERMLMAHWSKSNGSRLPDSISEIYLGVIPLSRNTFTLSVEYYFKNYDDGQAELVSMADKAF